MRHKKLKDEKEFANQLWNRINKYLFNYIDSIILIDVLIILFTKNEKEGVIELENYIEDVANITEISAEEVGRNLKRNSNIIVLYIL